MTMMRRIGMLGLLATLVAVAPGFGREARAGLVYVSTSGNGIYPDILETVNTSTGAVQVITTTGTGYMGLQFIGGQLYGEGRYDDHLYQINAATGAATDLGSLMIPSAVNYASFASAPNGLTYAFVGTGQIYTITPPSTSYNSSSLTGNVPSGEALAFGQDGRLYDYSYSAVFGYSFRSYDATTGALTSTLTLSNGGWSSAVSLFFDGATLEALVAGVGLFSIDTTTGNVTQLVSLSSQVGNGGGDYGIAAAVAPAAASVPEPSSLALCGIGGAALALAGRWRRRGLASAARPVV